jgi:hypothetical protein
MLASKPQPAALQNYSRDCFACKPARCYDIDQIYQTIVIDQFKPVNLFGNSAGYLLQMQQQVAHYRYELVFGEKCPFVSIAVNTQAQPVEVKVMKVCFEEFLADMQTLGYEIGGDIDALPTLLFPIFAVLADKRFLVGTYEQRDSPSNMQFEFSWLMPPSMRLPGLREEWGGVCHQVATELDMDHLYNTLLKKVRLEPESDRAQIISTYRRMIIEIYGIFATKVEATMSKHLANTHYTITKGVQEVLEENHTLVCSLLPSLLRFVLEQSEEITGTELTHEIASRIDFDSIRNTVRELGIGPNGSLGSSGARLSDSYLALENRTADSTGKLSLSLKSEWRERIENLSAAKRYEVQGYVKVYDSLKKYSEVCLLAQGRFGFNYGRTGLCPLYFESEGLVHAYDIWVTLMQLVVEGHFQRKAEI